MRPRYLLTIAISSISILAAITYIAVSSSVKVPHLMPASIDETQCDINSLSDGSSYAQVALFGGATCGQADNVASGASGNYGNTYTIDGYICSSQLQGSRSKWYSYWTTDYYSYDCHNGYKQIAFNWQSSSQAGGSSQSNTSSNNNYNQQPTKTVTIGGPGALQPTLPGDGQCSAANNYAQIAIGGGATCNDAAAVIGSANGSNFSADGYSCSATSESPNSNNQWSSYWPGGFYAYTCANGGKQLAFNWQSPTQQAQNNTITQ